MSGKDDVKRRVADIGERFLARTTSEIPLLREELAGMRAGTHGAAKRLEGYAHKIHGGGAMFGFEELSNIAHEIEVLAEAELDEEVFETLDRLIDRLDDVCRQAKRSG